MAMQMLDESEAAVALEKVDELPWPVLIPICFAVWYIGTRLDKERLIALRSMAPGGITEMCVAGLAMGANVPLILAYQLFRLLSINFISPFLINWYFKKNEEAA